MKKIKAEIKKDIADNGCLITIRMRKKVVGSKVFEGNDSFERSEKWIKKTIDDHQKHPKKGK